MKAILNNYNQSPRKVGLVAGLIRGKSVQEARVALAFMSKKSAPTLRKLLESAVANARSRGLTAENLFVKTITVDEGSVLRRYRPFARGRAGTVRKTRSIVKLELAPISNSKVKGQKSKMKVSKSKVESAI